MKKNVNELDVEFTNDMCGLYVVIDTTTNVEVSSVFTVINDVVAVEGFKRFLEDQKDKKAPYSKYKLRSVGMYNVISHRIETGESYDIVTDDEDIETYLKDIVSVLSTNEGDE